MAKPRERPEPLAGQSGARQLLGSLSTAGSYGAGSYKDLGGLGKLRRRAKPPLWTRFLSSHAWPFHLQQDYPRVPGRSGDCPGCRGGGKGAKKGPTRGPPFARCAFGAFGLKVEDGPAARLQGAGDERQVWHDGSPRGEGSGMPADGSPVQGRVLSGASLRQGVGVKPWEKALVQRRSTCIARA